MEHVLSEEVVSVLTHFLIKVQKWGQLAKMEIAMNLLSRMASYVVFMQSLLVQLLISDIQKLQRLSLAQPPHRSVAVDKAALESNTNPGDLVDHQFCSNARAAQLLQMIGGQLTFLFSE